MLKVPYNEFENNMDEYFDRAKEEIIIIEQDNGKNVVLLAEKEYNKMIGK